MAHSGGSGWVSRDEGAVKVRTRPFTFVKLIQNILKYTLLLLSSKLRFESEAGKNPITAVAFAEDILKGNSGGRNNIDYGILGIGTESGRIEVWAVPILSGRNSSDNEEESPRTTLLCAIPSNDCHFDTVKRVAWRPTTYHNASDDGLSNDEGLMELTLASCGQDNGVRIFKLIIRNAV